MKPAVTLGSTDRYILKELILEKSFAVTPGRVMFCRNRRILGYGDVGQLHRVMLFPKGTNTICLSAEDFEDVKGWIG